MKNKINIAKLLKDCPKGMELDCTMYNNVTLEYVCKSSSLPICVRIQDRGTMFLSKYGQWCDEPYCKCVIFPKGKTTWEGFVPSCKFNEGDIVVSKKGDIHLLRTYNSSYCAYRPSWEKKLDIEITRAVNVERLATEEEKQKLFQAIKNNGYKWNAETKILEKLPKFKDGDVMFKDKFIAIISNIEPNGRIWYHCWYNTKYKDCKFKNDYGIGNINDDDEIRFATEEEKQKLFDVIKENGYQWNAETKTLEELVEPIFKAGDKIHNKTYKDYIYDVLYFTDKGYKIKEINAEYSSFILFEEQDNYELIPDKFDISTLVPFENRVLVRTANGDIWRPAIYGIANSNKYYIVGGVYWEQCIPYENNEHLLGTTDDCDEYYKNW